MKKTIAATLIAISLLSCKKETNTVGGTLTQQTPVPTYYTSNFVDSSRITHQSKGSYYTMNVPSIETVEANSCMLVYLGNGFIYSAPSVSTLTNWIINKDVYLSGLSYTPPKSCPQILPFEFDTIKLNKPYTVTNQSIQADSVLYTITAGMKTLTKTNPTFSVAELNSIISASGTVVVEVKALNVCAYIPFQNKLNFIMQTIFHHGYVPVK